MKHEPDYHLYRREVSTTTGKRTIWYYYVVDETGKRRYHSTGETSEREAHKVCASKALQGELSPAPITRFDRFTRNFWRWGRCPYISVRPGRITRAYADSQRSMLENRILPFFANRDLAEIDEELVGEWIHHLQAEKRYAAGTINQCIANLSVILRFARRRKLIHDDPMEFIERLPDRGKERRLLTPEEVGEFLSDDGFWKYWNRNRRHFVLNLVAASTGMRQGEILVLRGRDVEPGRIFVEHSFAGKKYGVKETKTGKNRIVSITPRIAAWIDELRTGDPDAYLFSVDGKTPISPRGVTPVLYTALRRFGIREEERARRGITFHAWRHFLISELRDHNLDPKKIMSFVGHNTVAINEQYTHLKAGYYEEIQKRQEELFG